MLHPFLDTGAHGRAGSELGFLLQQTDRIARLKMDAAVNLGVPPGENFQQGGFAGAVEPQHANFGAIIKRE